MDDDGIKSALELAMERMSTLPELTPEEIAEQKEKEYKPIGEALGKRYLQNMIGEMELLSELNRYSGGPGSIVRKSLIRTLCGALQLQNSADAEKVFKGICILLSDNSGFIDEFRSMWDGIQSGFDRQVQELEHEFQASEMKALAEIGIAGSALCPNFRESEDFQKAMKVLVSSFTPEIEGFRSMLAEKLHE